MIDARALQLWQLASIVNVFFLLKLQFISKFIFQRVGLQIILFCIQYIIIITII